MTQAETYIKVKRSDDLKQLLKRNHKELILLTVIASRARRISDPCSFTGLAQNQAMIGDHSNYGMTEREYRTAKKNLEKWKFATFKGTHKGTIATITSTSIYDINCEQGDGLVDRHATDMRRTGDGQATTNKNVKKEKKAKNITTSPSQAPVEEGRESSDKKLKPIAREKQILDELAPPRRAIVVEWLAYKKQRKQVYQTIGLQKLIKNWAKFPDAVVQLAVDKSIESNYSGVFFDGIKQTTAADDGYLKNIKDYG